MGSIDGYVFTTDTPAKEGHIHGYTVAKVLIRGHILTRENFST